MRFDKFTPERMMEYRKHLEEASLKSRYSDVVMYSSGLCVDYFLNSKTCEDRNKFLSGITDYEKLVIAGMLKDEAASTSAIIMTSYWKNPHRKIWVYQEGFFDELLKVNVDNIQFRHLPKNLGGFVQLPKRVPDHYGGYFDSFFFWCGNKDIVNVGQNEVNYINGDRYEKSYRKFGGVSNDMVCISYCSSDNTTNYVNYPIPIDETASVRECWENDATHTYKTIDQKTILTDSKYKNISMWMNMLAYLASGDPDLRSYRNTIRYRGNSKTKAIRADSCLSTEEITLVGWNWKKDKSYSDEEWWSRPHLGWRRCGEGRTQLKLTWVKGSIKKWKKKEVEERRTDEGMEIYKTRGVCENSV